MQNQFKTRLVNSNDRTDRVLFPNAPEISETSSVSYRTYETIHSPGSINSYKNTASRTFSISGIVLDARNPIEASRNIRILHTIRGWIKPSFGVTNSSNNDTAFRQGIETGKGLPIGSPPPILLFSAYSSDKFHGMIPQHISKIPTVITSTNYSYPTDCDYIPSQEGIPVPTIMTIDISLLESHSPVELNSFNLESYRQGLLQNW